MKNKWQIWKILTVLAVLTGIICEITSFAGSSHGRLIDLVREITVLIVLLWLVDILFGQNPDDNDWVGQY